jgi:hypothetical protein
MRIRAIRPSCVSGFCDSRGGGEVPNGRYSVSLSGFFIARGD